MPVPMYIDYGGTIFCGLLLLVLGASLGLILVWGIEELLRNGYKNDWMPTSIIICCALAASSIAGFYPIRNFDLAKANDYFTAKYDVARVEPIPGAQGGLGSGVDTYLMVYPDAKSGGIKCGMSYDSTNATLSCHDHPLHLRSLKEK